MQTPRRSPRLRRRFKVMLDARPSFTTDVSPTGFCTEVMRVLPPGTAVTGTIVVNGRDIVFAGRVAWARPGNAQFNVRGRMGVSFQQIQGGFGELIATP